MYTYNDGPPSSDRTNTNTTHGEHLMRARFISLVCGKRRPSDQCVNKGKRQMRVYQTIRTPQQIIMKAAVILIFISMCCAASLPDLSTKELVKFKKLDRLLRELIDKRQSDENDASVNNTNASSTPAPKQTDYPNGLGDGATDSINGVTDFDGEKIESPSVDGDDYYGDADFDDFGNDEDYENSEEDDNLNDDEKDYRDKSAEYDDLGISDSFSEEDEYAESFSEEDEYADDNDIDYQSDNRDTDLGKRRSPYNYMREKSRENDGEDQYEDSEIMDSEENDGEYDDDGTKTEDYLLSDELDRRSFAKSQDKNLPLQFQARGEEESTINDVETDMDELDDYGNYEDGEYKDYNGNDNGYMADDKRALDRRTPDSRNILRMMTFVSDDKVSRKQLDDVMGEFDAENDNDGANDYDTDYEDDETSDFESASDRSLSNTPRSSRIVKRNMFERVLKRIIDEDERSAEVVSDSADIYGYDKLREEFKFPGSNYLDELIETTFITKRDATITLHGLESEWIPSSYIADLTSTMPTIVDDDPPTAALYYTRKLVTKVFQNRMLCPSTVVDRLLIRQMHDTLTNALLNKGEATMVTNMVSNILMLSRMPSKVADFIAGRAARDMNHHFYTDSVVYMVSVGLADVAAFAQTVHRDLEKFFEDNKATPSNINHEAVHELVSDALYKTKVHCKDMASFFADHAYAANTVLQQFRLGGEERVADHIKNALYNNFYAAFVDTNATTLISYSKTIAKCDFTAVNKAVHHYGNEVISRVVGVWKQVEQKDIQAFKAMLTKVLVPGEKKAVKAIMKAYGWKCS